MAINSTSVLRVAIAGSTERSVQCARALQNDPRFSLSWVLTPTAKPVGRKQLLTSTPLAVFASTESLPVVLVDNRLSEETQSEIAALAIPDFLLVVDFGYLVPQWLLQLPRIAPINIHPSALPRWRGSSPGQFALLFGETESAVSVFIMNEALDQGPLLAQLSFAVQPNWDTADYYSHSFFQITQQIGTILADFSQHRIQPQPQPHKSPTPIARSLRKQDTFIPWALLSQAVNDTNTLIFPPTQPELSSVLLSAWAESNDLQRTLERAVRAFRPWPKLWTLVPSHQGEKRLHILSASINDNQFVPLDVVIEGKPKQQWAAVTHTLSEKV